MIPYCVTFVLHNYFYDENVLNKKNIRKVIFPGLMNLFVDLTSHLNNLTFG